MRAPAINLLESEVHATARDYVEKFLPAVIGAALKRTDAGLLINEKSQSTYAVIASYRNGSGAYEIRFDASWVPKFLSQRSTWLILLDFVTSEAVFIDWDKMFQWVTPAMAGAGQGMSVTAATGGALVTFNAAWAASNGIIVRSDKLAKGDDEFKPWREAKLAQPEKFLHLHNHSHYSLLDGASSIEGMCRQASLNGQPGLALTDHGYMFGLYKFWAEAKEWGIKPILGCELYVVDDVGQRYKDKQGVDRRFEYHQTVLAMNDEGWANLNTIASLACRDNFYYVPRTDHKTILSHSAGLIILSGCFKGMGQWHLQRFDPAITAEVPWYRYDPDHSRAIYAMYSQAMGDRYYGEIQSNNFRRYMDAVPEILQMQADCGLKTVVTNDCHFETEADAILQRMVSRISSTKVDEIGDGESGASPYWIKPRSEIVHPLFTDAMFERTSEIMDRCTLDFKKGYHFPVYKHEEDIDWAAYVAEQQQTGR